MDLPEMRSRERRELPDEAKRQFRERTRAVTAELIGARLVRAVHAEQQLREVMIDFWSNHFSIFARKGRVSGVLPLYQREVLERHALGNFGDILLASARSPAMLLYLDNWISTAPQGRRGRQARRRGAGINENYARELLELHTLGVDGGYSQQDVREVARVLTGWTLESRERPLFRFREALHDPGAKQVLGKRVPGYGREQGDWLLQELAQHPSTARFISTKLAQRFVSDDPPAALIERATHRFLDTGGDIPALLAEILLSPEFADPEQRKLKTPLRFVVSALRATGGETSGSQPFLHTLGRLGELPYLARTPAGYPEPSRYWIDPAAVLERMAVAFSLARGRVRGARLGEAWPEGSARPGEGRYAREDVAVALAAPEFQWA